MKAPDFFEDKQVQDVEEAIVRKPKIHEVVEEAIVHEEPVVEQHHTDELTQAEEELGGKHPKVCSDSGQTGSSNSCD